MKVPSCFIIVEIGQAHDGSLGIAHSFIDALAHTGINAIKFQTHIAEAESSSYESFRVNFSYEDNTRYDYWRRMEFSAEQWVGLKNHADDSGLEFMSSPFSIQAVELLEKLGVRRYKIGSGEVTNFLMLEKIARTGKPVLLSTGMSSYDELDESVSFFKKHRNDLAILQCNTEYPTPPERLGLNVITELKQRYKLPVGLSDHSGSLYPSIAAVSLGATIVEVHCTFDREMFGPDSKASLTISEIKELVKGIRMVEASLNAPVDKNDVAKFGSIKTMFGKSLAVNKPLKKGSVLMFDDLESKKPGDRGIPAKSYESAVGKRLTRDLAQWDFVTEKDIE